MEETKTETQTNTLTHVDMETSLNKRILEKIMVFVNQYIIDFVGQEFIDTFLNLDKLSQNNANFANSFMSKLLEKLPEMRQKYNEIYNNNTNDKQNKQNWELYLDNIDFIYNLMNIPIINNIIGVSIGDGDAGESYAKHSKLNYTGKINTLMTEIVSMENNTLKQRQSAKILEFVNEFVNDFLGQQFNKRVNKETLLHENRTFVERVVMPELPALFRNYEKMRDNNNINSEDTDDSDQESEFQDEWQDYLTSDFGEVFNSIPIIQDIGSTLSSDDSGALAIIVKYEELDFNRKLLSLMNQIIFMT
jgi:hypothetical protein